MRTENDLREAIDILAGPEPDPSVLFEKLVSEPTKAQGPRSARILKPLIAAMAVAAVAVTGVIVFGQNGHDNTVATGGTPAPSLLWRFSVNPVPGYTITRDNIARPSYPAADISQSASVTATGTGKASGTIEFDTVPGKLAETSDVTTVAGVRYYYRAGHHVTRQGGLTPAQYADPWKAANQDAHGPQLSWHYPDGSQFIVYGTFGFQPKTYTYNNATSRSLLMKFALAVNPDQRDRVTMPFRLRALPDGLIPVSLLNAPPERENPAGSRSAPQPLSACLNYATPQQPSPQDPTESVLTVCRIKIKTTQRAALDGFSADLIAQYVVRTLPDGTLLVVGVGIGHTNTASRSELQTIAKNADVTPNLSNTTTWLNVN